MSTVFLDTEFTSLDMSKTRVIAIQLGIDGETVVYDVRHWQHAQVRHLLQRHIKPDTLIVAHNASADLHILNLYDIHPKHVFDTMLAALLLEGRGGFYSLQDACAAYAPHITLEKEVRNIFIDMNLRNEDWNRPFTPEEMSYMKNDITALQELYAALVTHLDKAEFPSKAVVELENALVPVVVAMESAGLPINKERWQAIIANAQDERLKTAVELKERLYPEWAREQKRLFDEDNARLLEWSEAKLKAELLIKQEWQADNGGEKWGAYKVRAMAEWRESFPRPSISKKRFDEINLDSAQQLTQAFFLAYQELLDSTDAAHLEKLKLSTDKSDLKESLALLLDYKATAKLVSTFGETLLARVGADGRVHAQFHQLGTDTGRFSCSSPNLQQIPRPRKLANLRSCVEAPEGSTFVVADLSNAELRILADESGDANMLAIFERGEDMHSSVARMMFNLGPEHDPKEMYIKDGVSYRYVAKTIGFGLAFGMGSSKLAETIHTDIAEAKNLIKIFFGSFPGVKKYLESRAEYALKTRTAKTRYGRLRKLPTFHTPFGIRIDGSGRPYAYERNPETQDYMGKVAFVERLGKNTPIQAGCADVVKLAMVYLHKELAPYHARIVACIHDEIVVETQLACASKVAETVSSCMTRAFRTIYDRVKIPDVEAKETKTWEK